MDVPSPLTWGTVQGHFIHLWADTSDAGLTPDAVLATGTITITPVPGWVRAPASDPPSLAVKREISCPIIRGWLCMPGTEDTGVEPVESVRGIRLVASDSPGVQPSPLQYEIAYKIQNAVEQPENQIIDVPADTTTWLPQVSYSETPGVVTVVSDLSMFAAEAARDEAVQAKNDVVALLAEAGALLPSVVADYLAANPVPDATGASKGILQLSGDLGGTADAPTVPGLADKAAAVHTHDDRYYTETEADALLSGKADSGHTHTMDDLTDFTPPDLSGYVVNTDTRLSDARPPTTHAHDDRYYTETETDALLSGKADSGHTHAGTYAPALTADQNYVSDAEKVVIGNTSGTNTGDQELPTWDTISGKPAVVAEGADAAAARTAIGAGTSSFSGNYADLVSPPSIPTSPGDIGAAEADHDHAITDVTGLETALGGKAPTDHDHDATYVRTVNGTGPDVSGNVVVASTDAEAVRDIIATALTAGAGVTVTPDDAGDTITVAMNFADADMTEAVQDVVGAMVTAAGGTYTDGTGVITFPASGTSTEEVQDIIGSMVTAAGGTYDDTAGTITLPTGGGGASMLDELTDVATTGAVIGQALVRLADGTWGPGENVGVGPVLTNFYASSPDPLSAANISGNASVSGVIITTSEDAFITEIVMPVQIVAAVSYTFSLWEVVGRVLGTQVGTVSVVPGTGSGGLLSSLSSGDVLWEVVSGNSYAVLLVTASPHAPGYLGGNTSASFGPLSRVSASSYVYRATGAPSTGLTLLNADSFAAGVAIRGFTAPPPIGTSLDDLTDVDTTGALTGHVLTRQVDGSWAPEGASGGGGGDVTYEGLYDSEVTYAPKSIVVSDGKLWISEVETSALPALPDAGSYSNDFTTDPSTDLDRWSLVETGGGVSVTSDFTSLTGSPGLYTSAMKVTCALASSSTATLTLTFTASGTISFYDAAQSEGAPWDFGRFFIDGVNQFTGSGHMGNHGGSGVLDWQQHTFPVEPGTHTFAWTYQGDSAVAAGRDAYFVAGLETVGTVPSADWHCLGAAPTHVHEIEDITATGTPDATTFLRGDGSWATPAGGDVGGVAWQGPWDAETSYVDGNLVTHESTSWLAAGSVSGIEPTFPQDPAFGSDLLSGAVVISKTADLWESPLQYDDTYATDPSYGDPSYSFYRGAWWSYTPTESGTLTVSMTRSPNTFGWRGVALFEANGVADPTYLTSSATSGYSYSVVAGTEYLIRHGSMAGYVLVGIEVDGPPSISQAWVPLTGDLGTFYTKSETDSALALKSPTSHVHGLDDLSDVNLMFAEENDVLTLSAGAWRAVGTAVVGGSGAQGTFEKFNDGLLICRFRWTTPLAESGVQSVVWTYPEPFIGSQPILTFTPVSTVPQNVSVGYTDTETPLLSCNVFLHRTTNVVSIADLVAIGRWK